MKNLMIDGNNLAYRCKFKYSLTNRGEDVSVTFGVIRSILSLIEKTRPKSVIVAWDCGVPAWRKNIFPEYKSNRVHADESYEDFKRQLSELHSVLPYMGIISIKSTEVEADDLLFAASYMYQDNLIVTSDLDLIQAVRDMTSVYNPGKDQVCSVDNFRKHFDFPLDKYVLWKALIGDTSDNIPGAHGIGEVTATKLVNGENVSKLITEKYDKFMSEDFNKVKQLIDLSCGPVEYSKTVIEAVVERWKPANISYIKKYFMQNSFISLMGSVNKFGTLEKPNV